MTMHLLAEAATGLDPATVGVIIGSVIAALLGGGVLGKKVSDSTRTTIDGQPLMVKMQDEFVTRREFESLESRMAGDVKEMKGLFREALRTISERDHVLQQAIKESAENDYKGRTAIWDQVNDQRARLKSVEDRIAKPQPR
jgi:hypothetical protein